MKTIDMESKDLILEKILKIKELFPNCVIDNQIDFNMFQQELSNHLIDDKKEKYQLTWPGKKECVLLANEKINKTLRPLREKSVDFDKTKNVYIEGDNLDTLKLLQESYLNKIKCIYIDPPYNTGNDFIYNDDFKKSINEELINSGDIDEIGNRLVSNASSNGRFHSDWLSMMYPRLKLARNLLSDDGLIFISIDDSELYNLKKICDEIFGENNYLNTICVETSNGLFGLKAKFASSTVVKSKDYVLVYSKNNQLFDFSPLYTKSKKKFDSHFTFYKNGDYECNLNDFLQNNPIISKRAKQLNVTANVSNLYLLMDVFEDVNDEIMSEIDHIFRIREYTLKLSENDKVLLNDGRKHIIGEVYVFKENQNINYLYPFSKIVRKSDDYDSKLGSCVIQGDLWKGFNDDMGNIGKEGGIPFENGKKPVRLIKNILKLINDKEAIVLDFFSGSATTAHAVMELNKEDQGNRKFILVQLEEPIKEGSQLYKEGFKTICDLGEKRIKNVINSLNDSTEKNGFRVYKVDSSNMKDVFYKPSEIGQMNLLEYITNIKEDRTPEDLLIQVMLDLGLTLDLKIKEEKILDNRVFFVENNSLVACFDDQVDINIIDEICKRNPLKIVFKDISFKTDKDKINLEERIKKLSPETEINIL